jgi:hypothetical protein
MINPSDEQMEVIKAIKDGYNVQVDAVAGSGKTTTVLSLAHYNCSKMIVQITYNSELKTEVRLKREKCKKSMELEKLEIHTYHSFATTYYSSNAKTDIGLETIINCSKEPIKPLPIIQILVIDEIQDMNELYYRFILKILKDTNNWNNIQILTLGDKGQGLYEFKGADTRYLTLSSEIFNFSLQYPFKKLKLSTSYRITKEIATFINDGMLGYERLFAVKNGPQVMYMRHISMYQVYKMIGFKLLQMLTNGLIKPDEIFILAPSVKSKTELTTCIKLLENMLVSNGIPCYVPSSETSTVNSEVIKNKVIFTSFHQSKGRERKMVVVFGFDDTYFKFFEREKDPEICPSTLYVATTRATETLILVECSKPLPFLNYNHEIMQAEEHIEFEGMPLNLNIDEPLQVRPTTPTNINNATPTDLIKFLDENVLIDVVKIMKDYKLFIKDGKSKHGQTVKITKSIKNQKYYSYNLTEEVSELNGLAIPAIFEERISKRQNSQIRRFVKERMEKIRPTQVNYHIYTKLLKDVNILNEELEIKMQISITDYLKVVNVYNSIREGLYFKVAQIEKYDWLNENEVDDIISNMQLHINEEDALTLEYEQSIIERNEDDNDYNYSRIDEFTKSIGLKQKIRFTGIVDAINEQHIYEFKCTENLEPEHYIQVIIYAWLWTNMREEDEGKRIFKLLNIRTGEMQELNYKREQINKIMELILLSKFSKREIKSDKEFVERCQKLAAYMLVPL